MRFGMDDSPAGAKEFSPRRKPWVRKRGMQLSPGGAKECSLHFVHAATCLLYRPSGALLCTVIPIPRAHALGYTLAPLRGFQIFMNNPG